MADMLRICMRKSRTPAEAIDRKDLQKPSKCAFAFVTRILGLGSIPILEFGMTGSVNRFLPKRNRLPDPDLPNNGSIKNALIPKTTRETMCLRDESFRYVIT